MILQVKDLYLQFADKAVLNGIDFHLHDGEIACLLGASGCGKTTILRSIAGFEQANSGEILLKNQALFDAKNHLNRPAHQRRIGMVFQDFALFPHLNVQDNIAFGIKHLDKKQRQNRIDELLNLVGLSTHAKHFPHELSGGQQQRVALARALAPKPDLLLLDEPFSSLDVHLRGKIAQEVRQLLKQEQVTALLVTHDQEEAFTMSDKIGVLDAGQLQQWATPYQLYYQPKNQMVASFIGQSSFIEAEIKDGQITSTLPHITLSNLAEINLQQSQKGQILLRPDNVILSREPQAYQGKIIHQEFKGQHFLYQILLENGEKILAKADSLDLYPLDSQVHFSVKNAYWLN
ncbi:MULTISPECIES: ABC transporter ATP-binding protein [unclassified Acinetobacter]|uniref:ABC transporter ATP-binding protein n=1 Tax=unclassified Acinetobacter TaxID=196816 RepID=UPI0035B9D7D0